MSKFVLKKAKSGFSFSFIATNGDTLAMSEVYTTKTSAKGGIASVQKNAGCEIEDQTVAGYKAVKTPKYEVYKDKSGGYRFRQKATNGQIVIQSTSGYKTHDGAIDAVKKIKSTAKKAAVEDESLVRKPAATKAPAKKTAAKKAPAKKTAVTKKAPAKKTTVAKKASAKK